MTTKPTKTIIVETPRKKSLDGGKKTTEQIRSKKVKVILFPIYNFLLPVQIPQSQLISSSHYHHHIINTSHQHKATRQGKASRVRSADRLQNHGPTTDNGKRERQRAVDADAVRGAFVSHGRAVGGHRRAAGGLRDDGQD